MRRRWRALPVLLVGVLALTACVAPPTGPLPGAGDDGPDPVTVARTSVVRIRAIGACGVGVGTGFVIPGRRIVTNRHVVEGSRRVEVETWDGRPVPVGSVRQGRTTDLAVIDLRSQGARRVPALPLAEEAAPLGTRLTALGYAEAGPAVATSGQLIDMPRGRRFLGEPDRVLRMGTSVRPGNSGGPLIDDDGEVVGVVYAYEIATQYSLAIPLLRLRASLRDPAAFEPVRPC
jgi:S1-C subfamily serine protease